MVDEPDERTLSSALAQKLHRSCEQRTGSLSANLCNLYHQLPRSHTLRLRSLGRKRHVHSLEHRVHSALQRF